MVGDTVGHPARVLNFEEVESLQKRLSLLEEFGQIKTDYLDYAFEVIL